MIVKKHIKQDQPYADTVLITGQRAHQVTEEEEHLWEETDHKVEEEEISIKGEAEAEEEEVSIRDKMDTTEVIIDRMEISEETLEEMQGKPHMKMEDKISDSMKKVNLTTVDTQIMEVGMMDMMLLLGIIATIGMEVKVETDMQIQLMDPRMDR